MQPIMQVLLVAVQLGLLLALSPFVVGLIRKVKARLQCRRGASIFQPYADLAELFRKQPVISSTTSWIFTAAPFVVFASTVAAGLLMPVFISRMLLNFAGNIIALVYLLALGTFFLILAGLDAGSAFGGMGSSREAIIATLAEPAMMLSILAIALTALHELEHHRSPVRVNGRGRRGSAGAFNGLRRVIHRDACGDRPCAGG